MNWRETVEKMTYLSVDVILVQVSERRSLLQSHLYSALSSCNQMTADRC